MSRNNFCIETNESIENNTLNTNVGTDKDITNKQKKLKKIPYSRIPSYVAIGIDLRHLVKGFCESKSFFCNVNQYYYDIRTNLFVDFNRLLMSLDCCFLTEKKNMEKERSLWIKINFHGNLLKKNSEHDSFFIGGGININFSTILKNTPKDKFNDKFSWRWFNISCGFRKSFFRRLMFLGVTCSLNFCKKKLRTWMEGEGSIMQEFIYGWGNRFDNFTPSVAIYLGGIIPIKTKDRRVNDDEYYFYKVI